jgi:hypothetical protein
MRRTVLFLVVAVLVGAGAVAGCAPAVRVGGPQHSCAPGFEPSNAYGRLTAQQPGPGAGVRWSVHPRLPVLRYVVDVYVDDRRVDPKDQIGAPHGAVAPDLIRGGSVFRLEGQAATLRGVGRFFLACRAA